jgi:YfiH family protein
MAGWQAADGLKYFRSPLLADRPEVVHGFFTRQGGVSAGAYHSLNVSLAVGDRREAVAENLRRMRQALGLSELAGAAQVHGGRAAVITSLDQAQAEDIPAVDILVTGVPGLGLLIKQADCQAVMFYDPVNRVVANVHCGWRGQVDNILGETVRLLQSRFGTRPSDLYAAVGPSLGPCCAEFINFRQEFPPALWAYQVRPNYFDLWRLSRDQLTAAGLLPTHLEVAGLCTRCRADDFYSYRREKVTGRQGAIIALKA